MPDQGRKHRRAAVLALSALVLCCDGGRRIAPSEFPGTRALPLRLVDLFEESGLSGRVEPTLPAPVVFEVGDARRPSDIGAVPGPGVSRLRVEGSLLTGRASSDVPILLLRRRFDPASHPSGDTLARVEIEMRATAGENLWLAFDASDEVDFDQHRSAAANLGWPMTSELTSDGELHRYTLTSSFRKIPAVATQNILIRPSDAKGARFGIESLRLVFASEELARVESGVGWHGLGEIYRETLAQRAGESIRVSLAIPPHPVLDLSIGTPNDTPVRFRARVLPEGATAGDPGELVLDRTATTPDRWESLRLPLDRFAGQRVTLALEVASERPDAVGYWGAAAVRTRIQPPPGQTPEDLALQPPQGVILFVADTLRRDHSSPYAYQRATAPNLAALSDEGARFDDVNAQASWTKVAIPSLLTGLYPSTHGVLDFPDRLPASAETLAESFRDAGYATLSLSSIAFSGRFTNLHQGFESVHEMGSLSEQSSSKTAREYVDRTLSWLELHRDQPFFIFLHVFDPHDPYEPRPPYSTLWAAPGAAARMERARKEITPKIVDPHRRRFFMPNREELLAAGHDPAAFARDRRDWYDGSIRGMDAEVGRLIERLREFGLDRKTLFVFTSDHGEEFFEHGGSFHGQSVYGELTHVPLILWWPGVIAPGTAALQTVQSIDIAPTILALSGIPIPDAVQGHTLLPLVTGRGSWSPRPAVSIKAATTHEASPVPRDTVVFSLVDDGWKLVHHVRDADGGERFELFNHGEDPLDLRDLAAEFPDTVARLTNLLAEWRQSIESARLPADPNVDDENLSDAELQRLRALGYVD